MSCLWGNKHVSYFARKMQGGECERDGKVKSNCKAYKGDGLDETWMMKNGKNGKGKNEEKKMREKEDEKKRKREQEKKRKMEVEK